MTACTSTHPAAAPPPSGPRTQGASSFSESQSAPLRPCASLLGQATGSAIVGEQVTCGFGGKDVDAHQVSVLAEKCPDSGPFYVFYATATDATDRYVYYGSEAGSLLRTTHQAANLATETREACEHN
jgi:hypothetical protein